MKTKKNPRNAGRKKAYGEETVNVTFRVPKSRKQEFRDLGNEILQKWKVLR